MGSLPRTISQLQLKGLLHRFYILAKKQLIFFIYYIFILYLVNFYFKISMLLKVPMQQPLNNLPRTLCQLQLEGVLHRYYIPAKKQLIVIHYIFILNKPFSS